MSTLLRMQLGFAGGPAGLEVEVPASPGRVDLSGWLRGMVAAAQSAANGLSAAEPQPATRADTADREDIRATLGGSDEAYARLVARHEQTIGRQMWRFTRDPARCEELVHEVFVEAYFSLKRYRGKAPLVHWLRRIATRVGYRYWKRRERERGRRVTALEDCGQLQERCASAESAEEAAAALHAVLDRLPPRDRLVLHLLYWEGCSAAEAAELAGWSRTMVRVQAHRARKKLKKLLEEVTP